MFHCSGRFLGGSQISRELAKEDSLANGTVVFDDAVAKDQKRDLHGRFGMVLDFVSFQKLSCEVFHELKSISFNGTAPIHGNDKVLLRNTNFIPNACVSVA
jgi:hypothetical protein